MDPTTLLLEPCSTTCSPHFSRSVAAAHRRRASCSRHRCFPRHRHLHRYSLSQLRHQVCSGTPIPFSPSLPPPWPLPPASCWASCATMPVCHATVLPSHLEPCHCHVIKVVLRVRCINAMCTLCQRHPPRQQPRHLVSCCRFVTRHLSTTSTPVHTWMPCVCHVSVTHT